MGADDVHEHVAEGFLDAIGVAAAVAGDLWFAVVWDVARDDVEDFFFAGAGEVGHRAIDRFLFDLGDFFERQLGLAAVRRGGFLVAFDELAG